MEDKLQILHGNLVKEGYDIPDIDTFRNDMSDPVKSKKLHDSLTGEGYELPDYDTFLNDMGLKKKIVSGTPSESPLASAARGQSILQDIGLPLKGSGTPQQQSISQSTPTPIEKPKKETSVMGDLGRALKSSSLRALGGITSAPALITKTAQDLTLKPIMRAMGASNEEAEAVIDVMNMTSQLGRGAEGGVEIQKSLNKAAQKTEAKMAVIEGNIVQNIGDKNWGAVGELVARGFTQALPYMAMTAATAGGGTPAVLSTIGATSAAQQYAELEGVSEPTRKANAWMYGFFEAAGELVTAGLLKGIGQSFRKGMTKTVEPDFVKGMAKQLAKDFLGESSSEGATQIGQNITDIITGVDPNRKIFDNVIDASIIGGVSGGGITTSKIAASMLGRAIASKKEVQQVQDNFNQQKVLIDQIEDIDKGTVNTSTGELKVPDAVKNALKSRLSSLQEEANTVMDENKRIAENISPAEQKKVAELFSVQDELQSKVDNGEVTKEEAPVIESTIQGIEDEITAIKESYIEKEDAKNKEIGIDFKKDTEVTTGAVSGQEQGGTDVNDLRTNGQTGVETQPGVENKAVSPQINPTPTEKDPIKLADELKNIEWYHGTSSENDLTKGTLDPWAYGDIGSLVGLGVYTTADPTIAKKYARKGGRVFKFKFNPTKIINGDAPITQDIIDAYKKTFNDNDPQVEWGTIIDDYLKKNPTASLVNLHKAIIDAGSNEEITKDSVVELFQDVSSNLSDLGYDGISHEGGKTLNQKTRHRVLIMLDPEGVYTSGKPNTVVSKGEYFEPPVETTPSGQTKSIYNKQDVIESLLSDQTEEGKEMMRTEFASMSRDDFQQYATQAGFNSVGSHWIRGEVMKEPQEAEEGTPPPTSPPTTTTTEQQLSDKERKPLGTQENTLSQYETDQQQIVADIVNENKEFYDVLHGEDAVANANNFIKEKTIQGATTELMNPTKSLDDLPTRQVARMVLIDHYSRILGDARSSKATKDMAYDYINKLQEKLSKEANKAGQSNAMLYLWKVMQPAGLLEFTKRKINDYNDKRLNKKVKGTDKTAGQLIDLLYTTLSEANKKVIDDILEGKEITSALPKTEDVQKEAPPKREVPKEKVKKEQDYRKNLLEDYKKKNKGVTLLAGAPITKEQMELGGNLIASYVREGYYRLADIVEKLKKDLASVNIDNEDETIDDILNQTKDDKGTYRDFILSETEKSGLKKGLKDKKLRVKDVVKKHYTEREEVGRTLSEKLVDDAYLTKEEADKLSKAIFEQYQKAIKERIESNEDLAQMIGREAVPSDKKKKTVMDKILEATNLGAMDTDFYRELFAGKFGLKPNISAEVGAEIMRLASVVQQVTNKGFFYRDAVIDLAKYIYEVQPQSVMREIGDTWIALNYAHMLMGVSTSTLNMISTGSNILFKPFRDAFNMSRHLQALKRTKKDGVWGTMDSFLANTYLPFSDLYNIPLAEGVAKGKIDAAEVYVNGDIGSKYIEEISKNGQFKVSELERNKYGKNRAFKPLEISIKGKKYTLRNPLDFEKFVARNLAAQDRLMFNTSFEMELISIIRDNLALQGLTGEKLTNKMLEIYRGKNINQTEIDKQVNEDTTAYQQLTGKTITPRQMKIRKRELVLESLISQGAITEEQKSEAEAIARGNVFTDDRGGMIATLANAIGRLSNHSVLAGVVSKPFVFFTKIVGNVTEFMLDHMPLYGMMRANGLGLSSFVKHTLKADPEGMTSQMGERGSRAYYEQMGRAWFGTTVFTSILLMALGNDEDDWFEITGGYNEEKKKNQLGREYVTPKYSIRFGDFVLSYQNIPTLAIPLALIGNLNDHMRTGMSEDELNDRFSATLLGTAVLESITMTRDMSFVQGGTEFANIVVELAAMDSNAFEKAGKTMLKRYMGFALRPLPQNAALVQQTWKFFDPTSYSQKDIKGILAYSAGIQHFVGMPSIDQLGDELVSYPGEAMLPYTHWTNIRGDDERWKFLADNNAIPSRIKNQQTSIDTEDGVDVRPMEAKEFHDYTLTAGKILSDMLTKYMEDKNNVELRSKERITERGKNGEEVIITGVQQDVAKMVLKSRDDARTQLFRWYDFKKTNLSDWNIMIEKGAIKEPVGGKLDIEIGKKIVTLTEDQMEEYNQYAMGEYHKQVMKYLKSDKPERDKGHWANKEKTRTNFDERISEDWSDAKRKAEDIMYKQLRNTSDKK